MKCFEQTILIEGVLRFVAWVALGANVIFLVMEEEDTPNQIFDFREKFFGFIPLYQFVLIEEINSRYQIYRGKKKKS